MDHTAAGQSTLTASGSVVHSAAGVLRPVRKARPTGTTAIYVRVSSDSQKAACQEPELESWVGSQAGPVEWFRDKFTGTTMDRPAWSRLWAGVEAGRITRIVIWRLDRLGRSAKGLLELRDGLTARKVRLHSLRDAIDLDTASGRLFWTIVAAFAEYETEIRQERQAAGIAVVRTANNGRCPWAGRKKGAGGKRIKANANRVKRLWQSGLAVSEIARAAGISRPTVYKLLATFAEQAAEQPADPNAQQPADPNAEQPAGPIEQPQPTE